MVFQLEDVESVAVKPFIVDCQMEIGRKVVANLPVLFLGVGDVLLKKSCLFCKVKAFKT